MPSAAQHNLAVRRRAYAVQLRSMRRTLQQIADAVLPCKEHDDRGGIDPATCQAMHAAARAKGAGPLVDCMPMYATREGARKAVEIGLTEQYPIAEKDREQVRRELLASADLTLSRVMRDVLGEKDPADRARAAASVVRLLDRMAKLTGADAPTRLVVTDELDDELSAALADLAGMPMPTDAQLRE